MARPIHPRARMILLCRGFVVKELCPSAPAEAYGRVWRREIATVVLPSCCQKTPHEDDLGRQAANLDRCGLLRLGRFGCPDYVVQGNF